MKLVVETLNEASGIRKDEWDLLNRVLGELTKSSTNRKLVKEFSNFIITSYNKQSESRQRTWDKIKTKRQDNPNYGRPEREWRKDMKLVEEKVWDSIEWQNRNNNWVNWWFNDDGKQYKGVAKVYPESSEFGIRRGKVSKFSAELDGKEIASYDRGWDVRPSAEHRDAVNQIIKQLDKVVAQHIQSDIKESIWNTDSDTKDVKHLTSIQLNKLADELLLEPNETITDAYFELGRLHVIIEDDKGNTTDYQPEFEQSQLNKILKEGKSMKLIKESATLSSKGKKALKESFSKNSKKLNETFAGMDVIDDLVDRAMGYVHDDYSTEDAIHQAIDDGLIYTKDIIDLAEHYGVIDTSELFDRFYEDLFNDMYTEVTKQVEIDEEDEEELNGDVTEALTEGFDTKSIADFIRNSTEQLKNGEQGLFRYKLDDKFALYVGWSAGYGNEKRDDVIQDPNDLDWGVNAGIKVHTSDYMQTDFDFLNYPYYENGDVLDNGVSIGYNENYEQLASYFEKEYNELKALNIEDDGKIIEDGEPLQEVMVDIDEDDLLDLLMNRVRRWTDEKVSLDLYEQMYQSYIDSGWDLGGNSVMVIVDNDWVNYCDVVGPGEENYDALLKLYQENGLGDVSVEDVGYSFIEAATEENGTTYLLCRW